ncbi:Putative protein of unknown function [Podospora comata]|uniref:Uncharacterized protein n=1 Tax=Podospora comata TaxID=48703 RepID=A0ABY6S3P0_PODCO|nr:Putative protein of unknown function [Podospora comata]
MSSPPEPCTGFQCPGGCTNQDCPSTWYPYTTQEYTAMFLSYYKFLTTLHYSPSDLKIPPPQGWPNLTREAGMPRYYKTDFAVEVMRHLPYLGGNHHYEYKSIMIDYSTLNPRTSMWFQPNGLGNYPKDDWWEHAWPYDLPAGQKPPRGDSLIPLTVGWESGGIVLILDVQRGKIIEEELRCDSKMYDAQEYFDMMTCKFRNLERVPCDGRILGEFGEMKERQEPVTEEEFLGQDPNEGWGTDLDKAYIKQLYREHGWPDNFLREECFWVVNDLMEMVMETRDDEWEAWNENDFMRARR